MVTVQRWKRVQLKYWTGPASRNPLGTIVDVTDWTFTVRFDAIPSFTPTGRVLHREPGGRFTYRYYAGVTEGFQEPEYVIH